MGAAAEPCPTWRGINLHTAENLRFASTSQLFQTYLTCLKLPVSPGTVHAWLMGSYQGPLSPSGLPDGEGSAQLVDGLTYTGTFKGGLLHGHGTLTKANSWSYTGTFSHNCIHGSGMYRWAHEASYNGQVYQGLPHGDGFMYTGEEDSCTYEGAWKHGLRHGQGKLIYGKNGTTKYEGRWVLDHKHGDGYHTYDSGSTFKGSWLQGKRNGKGRLVSLCSSKPSSCSYRGELGRLNLTQVYVYEGDWMDELSSGSGKSVWMGNEQEEASNQLLNCYVGDFERGIRHGHGTFYYASGAIYKGGWMENRKNGDGCYIHENGAILCGEFINGHVNRMEGGPLLKEPLQSLLENEENLALLKDRVSNVLMRHNSILRDVFSMYSHMMKGERKGQRANAPCTPHAILLDQIWQLCYDGNIVQCGLGLAQIDWLLRPTQTSWDSSPEIHKPNRQFIFREFIESVIVISKVIFSAEEFPLDEKVDKMVTKHFIPLLSKDYGGCSNVLMDVDSMRSVFDGYAPQLQKLFNETLRGIGTSDETITLRGLDLFFQRYKPQWGLQRERLLFNLIKGLYQNEIGFGDDGALYLDNDINFIEFQIAIFIYATNIKDQGVSVEPIIVLNNLIKEAILPNLSTDLESLMNEDLIPNLPNINTKNSNGISTSKTPRSVPGSKRSTPREGKIPPGAKSAPQTPLKKKH